MRKSVESQNTQELRSFDIQGHRGCRGLLPENTLQAFKHALNIGVKTIEMDVVISGDHRVVVSHDPWMSALICNDPAGKRIDPEEEQSHNLYKMTLKEIQQYDCGCRQNPLFSNQQTSPAYKPTLEEVISVCEAYTASTKRAPVHYNIELKSSVDWDNVFHPEPPVFCELVQEETNVLMAERRLTIQSFDARILRFWRKHWHGAVLALLVENQHPVKRNLTDLGFRPETYSPDHTLLSRKDVEYLHNHNIKVVPWTVNEKEDMNKLIGWGVDGLISDYPDRFFDL